MTIAAEALAREHMLKSQILTGHVLEPRLLDALMRVARAPFVPDSLGGSAYVDDELPLGNGRFLMEPLVFARLLQHAAVTPQETVLDVGTATGYSAAVLAQLARKVVALEEDTSFSAHAAMLLAAYSNVELAQGPLVEGLSRKAPYDVIVIEGAIETLPQALADQLREGGRLLAVVRDAVGKVAVAGLGKLTEFRKVRGGLYRTVLHDASVPLLAGFGNTAHFVF